LSVHDATQVVFFGDEVYVWLCGGTKKDIKYNNKELKALRTKSQEFIKKLGVDARDVEKVGFVLIHENEGALPPKKAKKELAPKPEKSEKDIAARKAQLQAIAAKGRAEREAKREAREASKAAKGAAFRARIDAARELGKKTGNFIAKPAYTPSGKPRGRPPGEASKPAAAPSGKPRGRPPGSVKRSADDIDAPDSGESKRSKKD
jgi:hypothetical protein